MKRIFLMLTLLTGMVHGQAADYTNFLIQTQDSVEWLTPNIKAKDTGAAKIALTEGGSTFELYTVHKTGKEYLLATKTVGSYLPKGAIVVKTTDPSGDKWGVKRTRIDQPFTVTATVSGLRLLTDPTLPESAKKVLMEQHIALYPTNVPSLLASTVLANTPVSTAFITADQDWATKITTLNYPKSSFYVVGPTTAMGEEHFVLHALADGKIAQTQLDTDFVQIWPLATGSISGVNSGQVIKGSAPTITVTLTNLYPSSTTDVVAYQGTDPSTGVSLMAGKIPLVIDRKVNASDSLNLSNYDYVFPNDGSYTIAIVTTDPFETRKVLASTSVTVNRTMQVRAMQVGLSDK